MTIQPTERTFTFFISALYLIMALIGLSIYGLMQAVIIYPVITKYTNPEKFIEVEITEEE